MIGDWRTPLLRDPVDVLRLVLLAGAVVAIFVGNLPGAVRLALTFLLVLVPRLLDVPRLFDLAFVLGMIFQGYGNLLDLFASWGPYDEIVHVVLTLAVAPLLYISLVRLEAAPDLGAETLGRDRLAVFTITLALGVTAGTLYELYEWLAVNAFGADLEIGYGDTIGDLFANLVAAAVGGTLLVAWAVFGWSTTRRVPEALVGRERQP